jgi:DNA repair exonuclease SbcCD ATPase subunit
MKNVVFENIKIKNFLSVGNDGIFIDFKKGITVITGENKDKGGKNGIGKSAIADALYWCLFGNTIRELKKNQIQHNKNDDTCEVSLNFSVSDGNNLTHYFLNRQLSPAKIKLEVVIDQKSSDITLSTIPETDDYIKNLIGANEEVFNNAVVMSLNNTVPFMAQKKTEKRKFIEGILQLNIFSEMLLKARGEYNDVKKENDVLSTNFIAEQRILDSLNNSKSNFDDSKSQRVANIISKITSVSGELENLKEMDIENVSNLKACIKTHEAKLETLKEMAEYNAKKITDDRDKKMEVQNIISQAKNDKQKILDKGNTCPTCNRDYCEDDLTHIESEIKRLDDIFNTNKPIYDDWNKSLESGLKIKDQIKEKTEENQKEVKRYNDLISQASLHEQKIKTLLEKIEEYRENIREIETESFKDDDKITKCEENIKKLENDIKEVKKQMAVLDSVKFIVSEEGVKTYIVKKIINMLNARLNHYLQTLDAPCKCVFDEMFEETLYNEQSKECSYFNFSGGERKRIDTAILFTFQDVMRFHSGTTYSLNIYDELLDCALDTKGTDKIMEILKDKVTKYNESIYIISHKASSEIANCDNIIYLEKSNGITRIVN